MVRFFFYVAAALLLGFSVLPFVIHLELTRTAAALRLRFAGAFAGGLIGLSLSWTSAHWRLHPVVLNQPLTFLPLRSGPGSAKPAAVHKPSAAPQATKESLPKYGVLSMIWRLWSPTVRLLRAFPGTITLKRLHLHGRFGFDNPAQTGSAFGYLQSLSFIFVHNRRFHIDLLPDFVQSGFQGQFNGRIHLHLGLLLFLGLRFGFQATVHWLAGYWRRLISQSEVS